MTTLEHASSHHSLLQYWPRRGELMAELLSTLLTSWLPTRIGDRVRGTLYNSLLPQMGKTSRVGHRLILHCAHRIYIGEAVNIGNNVCCDASTAGNQICVGDRVTLGNTVMLAGAGKDGRIVLYDGVHLDRGVDIKAHDRGYIEIGEDTYVGPYSCLAGPGSIRIGQHCLIASHCGLYANNHNFGDISRPIRTQELTCKGIEIGDDCWLGSGVKVLDGVRIGEGSIIGAGAVVTKDIPAFSVAVGVPATVISSREKMSSDFHLEITNLRNP